MGVEGGTRMFMACIDPAAARLSPARGPAAAKGEMSTDWTGKVRKSSAWMSPETRSARLQVGRSRRRRSWLLSSFSCRGSIPDLAPGTCQGPGVSTRPSTAPALSSTTQGSTARDGFLFLDSGGHGLHYGP